VSIKLLSEEEEVLFIGTQFSNLYTAVDTLSLSLSLSLSFLFLKEQLKDIIIISRGGYSLSPSLSLFHFCF
jgi:hypothetical protein